MDNCCCMNSEALDEGDIDTAIGEDTALLPGRCDECNGEIKPGEKYRWVAWAYESNYRSGMGWNIGISCNTCNLIFDSLCDCGQGRVWFFLWDHLSECIGISSPDELPEWTEDDEEYEADRIEYYKKKDGVKK